MEILIFFIFIQYTGIFIDCSGLCTLEIVSRVSIVAQGLLFYRAFILKLSRNLLFILCAFIEIYLYLYILFNYPQGHPLWPFLGGGLLLSRAKLVICTFFRKIQLNFSRMCSLSFSWKCFLGQLIKAIELSVNMTVSLI